MPQLGALSALVNTTQNHRWNQARSQPTSLGGSAHCPAHYCTYTFLPHKMYCSSYRATLQCSGTMKTSSWLKYMYSATCKSPSLALCLVHMHACPHSQALCCKWFMHDLWPRGLGKPHNTVVGGPSEFRGFDRTPLGYRPGNILAVFMFLLAKDSKHDWLTSRRIVGVCSLLLHQNDKQLPFPCSLLTYVCDDQVNGHSMQDREVWERVWIT